MRYAALLLLTTTITISTSSVVLRDGNRLPAAGTVTLQDGQALFRVPGGALYSLPIAEIDLEATRAADAASKSSSADERGKLRVSKEERDRLLRELEKNHDGQAPSARQLEAPVLPPAPSKEARRAASEEEWRWRREARSYSDAVREAREDLTRLEARIDELQQQISGFVSLGYKAAQFTYQTTQLEFARLELEPARVRVERAERANAQFLDDARRQDITPGWLR
jgi:hypothetical protein